VPGARLGEAHARRAVRHTRNAYVTGALRGICPPAVVGVTVAHTAPVRAGPVPTAHCWREVGDGVAAFTPATSPPSEAIGARVCIERPVTKRGIVVTRAAAGLAAPVAGARGTKALALLTKPTGFAVAAVRT
jgi:hypothetical protein